MFCLAGVNGLAEYTYRIIVTNTRGQGEGNIDYRCFMFPEMHETSGQGASFAPITFKLNGTNYGTLEVGDNVIIDKERNVEVNDTARQSEGEGSQKLVMMQGYLAPSSVVNSAGEPVSNLELFSGSANRVEDATR